ncbi:MAG: hypothetical protein IH598_13250, partial [Bacteroidales bacterium]|nr:hypothetical protein [Bacteroidales bacterium]
MQTSTNQLFKTTSILKRSFFLLSLILINLGGFSQTPIAWYSFTGNANDAVGSNHGAVNGATLTTDRFGNANSAYSFDGVDDNISCNFGTNLTSAFTVSCWYKMPSLPAANTVYEILSKRSLCASAFTDFPFGLSVNATGNVTALFSKGDDFTAENILQSDALAVNQWNFITVTFNANNSAELYINGVLATSEVINYEVSENAQNWTIGRASQENLSGCPITNTHTNGFIDEVKIYNTALTEAQVLAEFNSFIGQNYRSITSGDWSSPSTWEVFDGTSFVPATNAPTSADGVITIRNEHNVTVNSAVTVDQVVVEVGGTLTQNGAIILNNGIGNDLSVSGIWVWNGSSINGSGEALIATGGLLNLVTGNDKVLGANFINNGTIDWQDGGLRSSVNGLILQNNAFFTISGNNGADQINGTGNFIFNNNGTFTKTSNGGTGLNHFSLNNLGVLNINGGTLVFANGTINNSSPIILSNATLAVNEGLTFNWNTGSAITGSGVLSFNHPGSTLVLNNDMVIPSTTSLVLASNVTGAGNLTCNGALTLDSYYIEINGPGTLAINENSIWNAARLNRVTTVANGKTLTMAGGSDKWLGANLTNNGTIDWQDGSFRFTAAGVTCTNAGLFTISGNNGTDQINGTGNLNLINSGTLKKTSTGTTSFNHFSCTNNGTIQGLGTYNFMSNPITGNGSIAPGLSPGILTMDGQQPLSANSTLEIEILDGTGAGSGHDQLQRNGDLTLAGTITITETGIVPNGVYTIINLTSGTISGSFASVNLPAGYTLQINAATVTVTRSLAVEANYASQFGNSIVMNGTNDFVDCGNNAALNITSNLTLEAWIKPTAFGVLRQILHKGGGSNPDREGFQLRIDGGASAAIVIANGSTFDAANITFSINDLNKWMHIAGVYDGTTIKIYRNGILAESKSTTQTLTHNTQPLLIGKRSDGFNFEGSIDEVCIWNTARTATEIQNNMNVQLAGNETGLVGYWDMNRIGQGAGLTVENKATGTGAVLNGTTQGTATTPVFSNEFNIPVLIAYYPLNGNAADSSGNNLHGTIIGSVPGATDRNGNANGAVSFNGNTANRIEVDDNILLHTSSITIAAWVKLNSLGGIKTFVDKPMGNNVSDSWHLGTENSNFSCWHMNDPVNFNPYSQVTSPASTGQWHYVVNTFDNNSKQHKLYIDGVLKTTNTFNSSIGYDNSKLYIGAAIESGGLNFPMDGLIDEVKIYDKALTAAEITNELMNDLTASKPGSGIALSFDGVDDFITIPNSPSINFGTNNFSVEFWINSSDLTREILFQKRDDCNGGPTNNLWGIEKNASGEISFEVNAPSVAIVIPNAIDGKWHHIFFTRTDSELKGYKDGILVASVASSGVNVSNNTDLKIGTGVCSPFYPGNGFPTATLDEVRLWNVSLTETQIRDRMCQKITLSDPLYANLAAYYNFDESTGTTAFDATANANHGTLINGPARVISGAAIGETSVHNYVSSGFPGASLTLNGQDNLSVVYTAGTYSSTAGTHIYGVNENPNSQNGVNAISGNQKYFGVFTANISNPDYTTTYNYTGNPSVDLSNENDLQLFNRSNNASTAWTNTNATLNTTNKTLLTSNQQGEFMIGTTPLQETIVLRSGTGDFGQADANVKMLVGPSGTYFPDVFTSADFTAARTGPPALVTQNHPAWIASLPADPDARWINNVGNYGGGNTCLYAIDFMINGNVTNADIDFNFAVDNVLGGNQNQGVYINGQPLSGNTANIGSYSEQFNINRNDIVPLLQQGLNTLYVNATDLGPPGAVIFSATLNLIYSNSNPGFIAAPQSSCLAIVPNPLTGTPAFNNDPETTYQWQDSVPSGNWNNIPEATNGNSFAPPLLNTPTYYRRLATLNGITISSNLVFLDIRGAISPNIVPVNEWNVYAYNGTDLNLGAGTSYQGYYSVSGLVVNSESLWGSNSAPSSAPGYKGCAVNQAPWTLAVKRQGFTEGNYILNITSVDNSVRAYLDGNEIFAAGGFGPYPNITLGALNANSVIEIRAENSGGPGYLNFNLQISALQSGTIGSNQNNCGSFTPAPLTNVASAFGGSSLNISYQWQQSADNLTFADISGATASTYQPDFVADFIYIRRKAFNANAEEAFSNVVFLKNALPAVPVITASGATTFCDGGSVTLTSNSATGNLWSNGATTQSILVNLAGSYTVSVNSEGCTSAPSEAVVVTVLPLPEVSISGSSAFCPGGSAQLTASESISYLWNTGATTQSITVTEPGIYSVTVPGENGCEGSAQFTVEPFPLPVSPVSLLLPADSTYGIADPVTFSWSAAANATAYDLYIWRTNQQKPAIPSVSGITGTSYTYTEYLNKNYIYNWQVVARNLCYQGESAVRFFSFYVFTDLAVEQVTIPSNAVAGETVSFDFIIKNIGSVGTGIIPWKDDIYLSSSPIFDISTALKVASVSNKSSLSAGMSYTNSVNIVLPQYLEGLQYAFVKTDANNIIQETDETNNELGSQNAILVSLPPYPDLAVNDVQSLSGNIVPGESLTVGWSVENIGNASAVGGWSQRVAIISGAQIQILGYVQNTESLEPSGSIAQSSGFTVPQQLGMEGDVYLQVKLTPNDGLIEKPNGTLNNTALSAQTIMLEKRLAISLPQPTINENEQAPLQCMIFRSGNRDEAQVVNLSFSEENRVTLPSIIIIPANQAGAMFNISAINNNLTEGNIALQISADGNNYPTAVAQLTIIDDEVPGLSVSIDKIEASEGETFQLTVTRDVVTNNPLTVALSTSRPNQINLPGSVIIQGGESFASIEIPVLNDNTPEITESVSLNASSVGFVPASTSISIVDNDIPQITFTIDPVSVSEAGGPYASWGNVTLAQPANGNLVIQLSANLSGQLYFPSQISIPNGQIQKQFNVGVVDNNILDGDREIAITAAVFIPSCGCGAPSGTVGESAQSITIFDNDGPSLSASSNPFVVFENQTNAGILTITRNTLGGNEIALSIEHNGDDEIEIPATVIFPEGATSVDVPFNTLDDGIEDGNQIVSVNVSSENYSSGACWIMVSDRNLPDFVAQNLSLSKNSILINESLDIGFQIANEGFALAASGAEVKFYLSSDAQIDNGDVLISTQYIQSVLTIGGSELISTSFIPETTVGNFFIIANVNVNGALNELVAINNTSVPVPLSISPDYTATAFVNGDVFNGTSPITITGVTETVAKSPAPNKAVDVYVVVNGARRVLNVVSNNAGEFSVNFSPLNGEAGEYFVGACFPNQGLSEAQDEFTILGAKHTATDFIKWDMFLNETKPFIIDIQNLSSLVLNNVQLQVVSAPPGCTVNFVPVPQLAGNSIAIMSYSVTATSVTSGNLYQEVKLQLTSAEGIKFRFSAWFYSQATRGNLKLDPVTLNKGIVRGSINYAEFEIINNGMDQTGLIKVILPQNNWMSLACPDTISSLLPGQSASVTLTLIPGDDLQLNNPITGQIALSATNANSVALPFSFEPVSIETGSLLVDVVDEYTFNTESAPHLEGATVVVSHPYTGQIIAQGLTDVNGHFLAEELSEGFYNLKVTALHHGSYQNNIYIEKGIVNNEEVFIDFQAITYSWEVIPTQIEDQYVISLVAVFETNVPAPVIVMNMPDSLPQLANGEVFPFILTLTNHGLITARDAIVKLPDDPEYLFTANVNIVDILPQTSVQIPVIMERRPEGKSSENGGNCRNFAKVTYKYICGPNDQIRFVMEETILKGRYCSDAAFTGGSYGGVEFLYSPGNGSSAITIDDIFPFSIPTTIIVEEKKGCDPCLLEFLNAMLGCTSFSQAGNGFSGKSIKGGTIGTVVKWVAQKYPSYVALKETKDKLECAYNIGHSLGCKINEGLGEKSGEIKSGVPAEIILAQEDMFMADKGFHAIINIADEIYNNDLLFEREDFGIFNDSVMSNISGLLPFDDDRQSALLNIFSNSDITPGDITGFVNRWNSTMDAWDNSIYSPTPEFPDVVDTVLLYNHMLQFDSAMNYVELQGLSTLPELYNRAFGIIEGYTEQESNSVCAKVSVQFSQSLTMTREAFEGTLTIFNGHETDAMQNIMLDLEIRDEEGNLRNDLFQINTQALNLITGIDGSGTLGAQTEGSAVIQFIPERGAALDVPKYYSFGGTLSYLDPFTGEIFEQALFPVTLQVNPSPNLFIDYFMQRDILGDDALTEPIEPMVPAELAVMIDNQGAGTAYSVNIESAQPEIIENEKGLLIDFNIVGSNLGGKPTQLGLLNVDFGSIEGGKIGVGQWWFTSSLLGHFISYEVKVNHLNSFGNPDLSLVSDVQIHELIKSVSVYGLLNDSIGDFLVNDIPDTDDIPDALYYSSGIVAPVYQANSATVDGPVSLNDLEIELTVTPFVTGWNYIKINDPGN